MIRAFFLAVCGAALVQVASPSRTEALRERVAGARQHLLVVTEAPGDTRGRMYRMEREVAGVQEGEGSWHRVGAPIPVTVGWGGVGPKREGDGRSPQGAFSLGPVFGYSPDPPPGLTAAGPAPAAEPGPPPADSLLPATRVPYLPLTSGFVCVDDPSSVYYNRVFDADTLSVPRDWASAEAMRRDLAHGDDLYEWGVVVGYNEEAVPGEGSCIFLHVWRGAAEPTAGCTAMAEDDLLTVVRWLGWGAREAVLVQGTRAWMEGLRLAGVLPYGLPR